MSNTELERHLLQGLEKMEQENPKQWTAQEAILRNIKSRLEAQSNELSTLQQDLKNQKNKIQMLSEYYNSLEPLLQRLNHILKSIT